MPEEHSDDSRRSARRRIRARPEGRGFPCLDVITARPEQIGSPPAHRGPVLPRRHAEHRRRRSGERDRLEPRRRRVLADPCGVAPGAWNVIASPIAHWPARSDGRPHRLNRGALRDHAPRWPQTAVRHGHRRRNGAVGRPRHELDGRVHVALAAAHSGFSVSLSSDAALIGARLDGTAAGADAGPACVFTRIVGT